MTTETKEPLRGPELLRAAVNQIIEHPDTWNQSKWHCGTRHCIAGWCQVLAGKIQTDQANSDMRDLVGLSDNEASWLSEGHRSLSDIYFFAKNVLANRAGFDRAGFNRDGFDRAGFDRAGTKLPLL